MLSCHRVHLLLHKSSFHDGMCARRDADTLVFGAVIYFLEPQEDQDLDLCLSEGGTLLDSSFALRQRDTSPQRVFSTSGTRKLGILVKPHQTVLDVAVEKLPRRISLVKFVSLLLYRSATDSTTQNRKPLPHPRVTKSSGPPGFCSTFFMTHL